MSRLNLAKVSETIDKPLAEPKMISRIRNES